MTMLNSKKNIIIVISALILAAFLISLTVFLVKKGGTRRTYVFPSVENDSFIIESRRHVKSYMNPVEYYVNELMLGPQTERCRSIFPKETKILSIFVNNKTLYVDFSGDIVNPETESHRLPLKQAIELFKENVQRNFRGITSVQVFVEGNPAYEGE